MTNFLKLDGILKSWEIFRDILKEDFRNMITDILGNSFFFLFKDFSWYEMKQEANTTCYFKNGSPVTSNSV